MAAPGISPFAAISCNVRWGIPLILEASEVPTRSIANSDLVGRLAPIALLRFDQVRTHEFLDGIRWNQRKTSHSNMP